MPCGTLGSVKGVPQDILEELGGELLLGDTTGVPPDRGRAQRSMVLTLRRAWRSKGHFEAHMHDVPWAWLQNREIPHGLKPTSSTNLSARLMSCSVTMQGSSEETIDQI